MRARHPIAVLAVSILVSGCVQAQGDLSPGFAASLSQNLAAQVADPDAAYRREDPPAASGERAASAQQRYDSGRVTPLAPTGASSVGAGARR